MNKDKPKRDYWAAKQTHRQMKFKCSTFLNNKTTMQAFIRWYKEGCTSQTASRNRTRILTPVKAPPRFWVWCKQDFPLVFSAQRGSQAEVPRTRKGKAQTGHWTRQSKGYSSRNSQLPECLWSSQGSTNSSTALDHSSLWLPKANSPPCRATRDRNLQCCEVPFFPKHQINSTVFL